MFGNTLSHFKILARLSEGGMGPRGDRSRVQ